MAMISDTEAFLTEDEKFKKEIEKDFLTDVFTPNQKNEYVQREFDRRKRLQERAEEEALWVKNLCSQEQIDKWKNKGAMGIMDVWHKKQKHELIPYAGALMSGESSLELKSIADRLYKGEEITPEERQKFKEFALDMGEVQTRGYTFMGGVTNIGLETIPFMAEFALGLLTTGGASSWLKLGAKAAGDKIKKQAIKAISEKTAGELAVDVLKGTAMTAVNTLRPKTFLFTAERLPQQVWQRYGDMMLTDSVCISPEGYMLLKEADETPGIAFMKAIALMNIETASEMSGGMLVRPAMHLVGRVTGLRALKNMVSNRLPENFIKLTQKVTKMPFLKAVGSLGYDGVLEEIGEERIGDLLRVSFNMDEKEGYSLDDFLEAAFPSLQEFAQEAVSFALTGAGANITHAGLNRLSQKYSKDEFLIDAGIFRVLGYDSYIDGLFKKVLHKEGRSDDDIQDMVNALPTDDKIAYLKEKGTAVDTEEEFTEQIAKIEERKSDYQQMILDAIKETKPDADEEDKLLADSIAHVMAYYFAPKANPKEFIRWILKAQRVDNMTPEEVLKMVRGMNEGVNEGVNESNTSPEIASLSAEGGRLAKTGDVSKDGVGSQRQNGKDGDVLYQSANTAGNLLMSHAAKADNLNDILESGTLLAPSMAITKKDLQGDALSKFGQVLFIRNPQNIDYESDNIYNRDIYSPRMPRPMYKTARGSVIDEAEYESLKREAEKDPDFTFSGMSFDEYVGNAEKVLFAGFDKAGNRKYIPYTKENILKEMKKQGLVAKEGFDYGLSSFLARFSKKQTSKGNLKKEAEKGLGVKENLDAEYEKLQDEYADFADKLSPYYRFSNIYGDLSEGLYAIAANKTKTINELFKDLPQDLIKEVKDFADKAVNLPRSYFEAKPMREVSLNEFTYAIVQKDTITPEQKTKLENYGIEVVEYEHGKQNEALKKIHNENPNIYFQSSVNKNNPAEIASGVNESITSPAEMSGEAAPASASEIASLGAGTRLAKTGDVSKDGTGNEKITPVHIDKNSVPNFDKVSELKKWIANNLNLLGEVNIKSNGRTINFNYGGIGRSMKGINRGDVKRNSYAKLRELVENAQYAYSQKADERHKDKNNGQEIYYNAFEYDGKIYGIQISIDIPKNKNQKYNYAGHKIKTVSAINVLSQKESSDWTDTNTSINHIHELFKPLDENGQLISLENSNLYYQDNYSADDYSDFDELDDTESLAEKLGLASTNENGEKTIAGYTYVEIADKLTALHNEVQNANDPDKEIDLQNKIQILYDALAANENNLIFNSEKEYQDLFVNAYYVMNDMEIPKEYTETPKKIKQTYAELKKMHNEKKEKAMQDYLGFFQESEKANIISMMSNHNKSTLLHESAHLFLNGLNTLANSSEEIREDLQKVNQWLGAAGNGEYTTEQHEKFARSFEAFMYKGQAPNSNLKRVFENFKDWLKTVYLNINLIEKKGADISDEAHELFSELFAGEEFFQNRKETNEILKKIEEKSRQYENKYRPDTELDEVEKRHKEIAYDILSAVTGYKKQYLKTIFETRNNSTRYLKIRETVEKKIETSDRISSGKGFLPEWGEFFSDTGVSYDNQDINGDAELGYQALDCILNKAYTNPARMLEDEYSQRAAYFDVIITNANRAYKIILSEYKNGNRNAALAASYQWLESLDPQIKEDYEDRFIYDTAIIERDEHVNKFDKAKRRIIREALKVENQYGINQDEKYKELVKSVMKNLTFLNAYDKAKLTANILDISSTSVLSASLNNIMDIAQTMEDVHYRRRLEAKIHNELKQTKNIKKNGRKVGKYDYRTNKIFEILRSYDRLSPSAAQEILLKESEMNQAENNGLSPAKKLINMFLSYKAGGRTYADTDNMKTIYDEILRLKLIGKHAKTELDMLEEFNNTKEIDDLIDNLEKQKKSNGAKKTYINWFANLESTLNALFGKKTADKYGSEILYAETQSQAWQYKKKKEFQDAVAKIYNLPAWNWDFQILKYLGEKHTYKEIRRTYDTSGLLNEGVNDRSEIASGVNEDAGSQRRNEDDGGGGKKPIKTRYIEREMTKMDIICAFIWSKNEVLNERLSNQFEPSTLDDMFDELSIDDIKFANLCIETASSSYPLVNKAFIAKYGIDLPKVSCYFPSTPERGSEIDLFNEYSSKSLNNSFTKLRTENKLVPMDFHNPVQILFNHIEGVGKFVFMSEALDKANIVFTNPDLKRAIISKYGEDVYKTLYQQLLNVTYKKEAPVFNGIGKVFDNLMTNWITGNIAVKPVVGLKQLLSASNYAVDMPVGNWTAGFLNALANFNETIDYMMSIPYLKARFQGNFSNEFLKSAVENSAFAASKKLKDTCTLFVRLGDIGAIIFGGKPYIDYLINEKGMSEENAIKQFILSTNRSQQSSAVSSLSNFQVAMTRNPFGKIFIAFKNAPQQYVRMCGDAVISCMNGDITKAQAAKTIFNFAYLQPFLYALATSGSLLRLMFAGEPDDFLNDLKLSFFDLNHNALPMFGDIWTFIVSQCYGNKKYITQTTPLMGDIMKEIHTLSKQDADLGEILTSLSYILGHVGLGYNTKAIINAGSGIGDIATGHQIEGAMKLLGYTNYRAKHIAGEDK